MAHLLGALLKYFAAIAIFIFSISLSYTFFSSIAPPDMPWFVWAALGLTEIGLLCWLGVFMMQRHQDAHKTIALVMIVACVAAVIFTDAMELAHMFHVVLIVAGMYYYGMIVLLIAHLLAFIADFFVGYFAKYSFYGAAPQGAKSRAAQPKEAERSAYAEGYAAQSLAQTDEVEMRGPKGPGLFVRVAASALAASQEIKDLAAEKRRARRERAQDDPLAEASQEDEGSQGS